MALMILPAKEDREDADATIRFVNGEPEDRATNCHVPQARQEIIVSCAAMRGICDPLCLVQDVLDPLRCVSGGLVTAFAKLQIAGVKMLEDQPEIALGLGGELNPPGHCRRAWY